MTTAPTPIQPGTYYAYGTISDGPRMRYLYSPQKIVLDGSRQPPILVQSRIESGLFHCTVQAQPGQRVAIEGSTNLVNWVPIATNFMAANSWDFSDPGSAIASQRFYRAVLQ